MDAESRISVRWRALGLYLLALFLAYLAGSYVAIFFLGLFFTLVFLLSASFIGLLMAASRLRYHQEFSTEHPVKGESVIYHLSIANESLIPLPALRVRFKRTHPLLEQRLSDFRIYLGGRVRQERQYTVACPYRGIYTVGLEALEVEDLLGMLRLRLPVLFRTFYVYPRVLTLPRFRTGTERRQRPAQGSSSGGVADPALFARLRAYRQGEPLRHLAWKKFAATGRPFLKEYDSSAEPGIALFFDLRETGRTGTAGLEAEDVSVEILVALVRHYLSQEVPLTVRAAGRSGFQFRGQGLADFPRFYEATMELIFQPAVSPAALYRAEADAADTTIIVTHLHDPEVIALLEESLIKERVARGASLALVLNESGRPAAERRPLGPYLQDLSERGAAIRVVHGAGSMLEDLARETGARA
jgi:uncharacterized protein (DUF58 family)